MYLLSLIFVTLLSAIAISVVSAGDTLQDEKRDCYMKVVCETEEGYIKALDCSDKLMPKDQEFAKSEYRKFVGDDANDFETLVRISCKNRELADNATTNYLNVRLDNSESFTLEENKKFNEAKVCFGNIIDNCIRKSGVSAIG